MAQHFLLSAKVRNLSLTQIAQLADTDILPLLKTARWGNTGKVACPRCQHHHEAYFISSRQQWQCKCCQHRFSITAGTIFHLSKLSLRQILIALYLFAIKSKGISAVELSHELGVQYKTAFVLLHKFREALDKTKEVSQLKGEVHIDGCYINHYIRPRNFRHRRIDRRKRCYQREDKACLMVFRQRASNQDTIQGADRSIVALIKEENTADVIQLTKRLVKLNSTIFADENPAYDHLAFYYDLWRVNHSQEYRSIEGITNNLAESFFARFRRMTMGVHHKMKNKYALYYANEIAWREDSRRKTLREKFDDLLQRCLNIKPSRDFIGYWQGNKKTDAKFGVASIASNDRTYQLVA